MQQDSNPIRISFISAAILILELTLIRIMPAENHAVSYFTNLMLMSSFFGLGIGCILGPKRQLQWLLPFGLFVIALFIYFTKGMAVYESSGTVFFWLEPPQGSESYTRLPLIINILWAFLSAGLPFIPLGQILVQEMD